MRPYLDEELGVHLSREDALQFIKEILSEDTDLLGSRDIEKMSEDDLFEIGHHFYAIIKK